MQQLENILIEIENSQYLINVLLKEISQFQRVTFKNIICNRENQINKKLFKAHELEGRVNALMWVISK